MKVKFTEYVMAVIRDFMDTQDRKGVEKYGKTLDDVNVNDYDWNVMALEEMVDCNKYLIMQNRKLNENIKYGKNKGLNHYCRQAFETALMKGWHDKKREFGTYISLMHSELSEALEADRRNEGVDRVTEELADVVIRIFDWCGLNGIDFETVVRTKMEFNKGREIRHGGKKY